LNQKIIFAEFAERERRRTDPGIVIHNMQNTGRLADECQRLLADKGFFTMLAEIGYPCSPDKALQRHEIVVIDQHVTLKQVDEEDPDRRNNILSHALQMDRDVNTSLLLRVGITQPVFLETTDEDRRGKEDTSRHQKLLREKINQYFQEAQWIFVYGLLGTVA